MNFDELKNQWAAQNDKLDRLLQINTAAVRQAKLAPTKSGLKWLLPGIVIELMLALIAVVWLGSFLAGHVSELKFLLPGLLLDACAIALLGSCIRQLMMIFSLDYDGPIVALQKGLEELRVLRIRTNKWTMMLSLVLWFPVLIVGFEGLLGVDSWMVLGVIRDRSPDFFRWIAANLLLGVAVVVGVIWASQRYADRFARSPFMRGLMDDFAGRSLLKAQQSLAEIARFEAD